MDIDWNAARIATNAYNRKIDRQTLITERNAIKADLKNCELGARLLVAFGGPNIWIDTSRGIVEGYWWQHSAFETFDTDTDNACDLHDHLEMIWSC